jgi:tetratricopeptide (TPR) repeat protein
VEGRDNAKALKYFLKAGDRAMKMHANEEAASHFESALNLLDRTGGDVREKARVAETLGKLKNWNREYEASLEYFNEALMLLKETGDKRGLARVYTNMSGILVWSLGKFEEGLTHLNEALKILENEPESPELANAYWSKAFCCFYCLGNLSEAVSLGRRALSLAEKLGDLEIKAWCYVSLLFTELVDLQKAIKYIEEGLEIAMKNNYYEAAAEGYYWLPLHYYFVLGDFRRAMEYSEEGLKFARKVGLMTLLSSLMAHRAFLYAHTGDLQKAIETAEETMQPSKKTEGFGSLWLGTGNTWRRVSNYGRMG